MEDYETQGDNEADDVDDRLRHEKLISSFKLVINELLNSLLRVEIDIGQVILNQTSGKFLTIKYVFSIIRIPFQLATKNQHLEIDIAVLDNKFFIIAIICFLAITVRYYIN